YRTPAGIAQPFYGGVGMFRRMVDLADIHDRRDPGIQLGERSEKFIDVDVFRPIDRRQLLQHGLIIVLTVFRTSVVDEDRVGKLAAQRRLELVVVGVDEAWHDDLAASIYEGCVVRRDVRSDGGD